MINSKSLLSSSRQRSGLEELKTKVCDKAYIIKINTDKNPPQAASAYKVQSVPTLMLFKNGNVVWGQS